MERFGGLDGDEAAEAQAAGAYLSELGLGQDGKSPSWVDRFMEAGAPAVLAATMEHEAAKQQQQQRQQQQHLQGAGKVWGRRVGGGKCGKCVWGGGGVCVQC